MNRYSTARRALVFAGLPPVAGPIRSLPNWPDRGSGSTRLEASWPGSSGLELTPGLGHTRRWRGGRSKRPLDRDGYHSTTTWSESAESVSIRGVLGWSGSLDGIETYYGLVPDASESIGMTLIGGNRLAVSVTAGNQSGTGSAWSRHTGTAARTVVVAEALALQGGAAGGMRPSRREHVSPVISPHGRQPMACHDRFLRRAARRSRPGNADGLRLLPLRGRSLGGLGGRTRRRWSRPLRQPWRQQA